MKEAILIGICPIKQWDCSIMLEYRIIKTTEYSIRISSLDTPPYINLKFGVDSHS